MNINKEILDNKLIIKLTGRLDTNTISNLEKELINLEQYQEIVFDFEKLSYISSAGLRLILKCKKTVNNTTVINCTTEVYEVFNITGFTEMMDVSKAYRQISIDGCEVIGEGFYGKIYKLDEETIVKYYKIPDAIEMIKSETELAKRAFVMGIPTAIPFDIVRIGDSYGAVFELLNASPFVELVSNEKKLDDFAKESAQILKDLHSKEIKDGSLPKRKEETLKYLLECKELLSKETYHKLHQLIETIPDTNTLLHSDFHVKNIMKQKDDLLIIDMATLSIGHPIFEFAAMYSCYIAFSCVDKENTDKFFGLSLDTTTKIFNKTLKYYYSDKTEAELDNIILKLSVISFLKVLFIRHKYSEMSYGFTKEEIAYCIKYLTDTVKKLDSLNY